MINSSLWRNKMKNKLGYLGLIGVLGVLGIITENKGYLAFFAYFVFFRYFTVRYDELFQLNVQKAATPAFFTGLIAQLLTITTTALTNNMSYLVKGLALSFSISTAVFIIRMVVFEYKELKGV